MSARPSLGRELHELPQVFVLDRLVFRELVSRIALVVPYVLRTARPIEEYHIRFHAAIREEDSGRERENRMEIESLKELFFDLREGVVGREKDSLGHDDGSLTAELEILHEVLEEKKLGRIRLYREIPLNLRIFHPSEGRIREDDIVAIFLLDTADILGEGVLLGDIGTLDTVEDHIHRAHHVGERSFFVAVEGIVVELVLVVSGAYLCLEVIVRLHEESCTPDRTIIHCLSDPRIDDRHHGTDDGTRSIKLAGVSAVIAHALQERLVDVRELEYIVPTLKIETVDDIEDFAKSVPVRDFVVEEFENPADLVLDRLEVVGDQLEAFEIGEELFVDVVFEVFARLRELEVDLAVCTLRTRPYAPPVGRIEDILVRGTIEKGFFFLLLLVVVEVLQEEYPRDLLGVLHGSGDAVVSAEDIGDTIDGGEHESYSDI